MTKNKTIHVVGAGLAGSECALQLADMGYLVELYEMRLPVAQSHFAGEASFTSSAQPATSPNANSATPILTPAHKTHDCAELVCSNSFGGQGDTSAPGQIKWEAAALGSHILAAAKETAVPAGQALGVDRERFSALVTQKILSHPNIKVNSKQIQSLSDVGRPAVIATGPLTSDGLSESLRQHFGDEFLYFFDAIAPIIDVDSINMDIAWKADRYDKGSADYINCPLEKDKYYAFIDEVLKAKKIEPKHFEITPFFEGCMPIEVMAARGPDTLSFGPMKPVGLKNPRTGKEAWAVVQLRQDNKEGTAFNMVGFQTRMAYGEQVRVFRTIPGLEQAEFLKLGSIHRNLYINSPKRLNQDLSSKNDPWLFFAGQITGVEGYFESTCIGLLVAKFLDQKLSDRPFSPPPRASGMGSLLEAITDPTRAEGFQPTNINFGLLPPLPAEILKANSKNGIKIKDKNLKKELQLNEAKKAFAEWKA